MFFHGWLLSHKQFEYQFQVLPAMGCRCIGMLIDAAAPTGVTKETADQLLTETLNDRPKMMRGVTDNFFFQYITGPFSDWFFQIQFIG